MALLKPVTSARISQPYKKDAISVEPTMYWSPLKSYWRSFSGGVLNANVHAAIDFAAPAGTPILASEAGTVSFAGWKDGGGGNCVFVSIRPNVQYSNSHMATISVRPGQKVVKGQKLGTVGATGLATGPHTHFQLLIREWSGVIWRTFLYDPALFMTGGLLADDPRIKPL